MKLALIGGGGVRAPLFVQSALRRAERLRLSHICLMDTDADQLALIGRLCGALAERAGVRLRLTTTTEIDQALDGASFVVTTIRPGGADGRVADERIAIENGVIGQETTGAGGFAMAMRSIPALIACARRMARLCPDAWLLNFTNPAGLVTQALHDEGFARVVGICDSANGAQTAVARWFAVPEQRVEVELFGLNHLSFARSAVLDGRDVLPDVLSDDGFLAQSAMRVFERELVRRHRVWISEYLYYYYYSDKALAAQRMGGGRGEEIKALNAAFLPRLKRLVADREMDAALELYFDYEHRRSATYMRSAWQQEAPAGTAMQATTEDGEGYAGVALDVAAALMGGPVIRSGLNVRNGGAITDLRDDDVVEIACTIDRNGVTPHRVGEMPERQAYLVQAVKHYERLAVEAIRTRRIETAVEALAGHPLVMSYARARRLVTQYVEAHAPYTKRWA